MIPQILVSKNEALELSAFKRMDYDAVDNYHIPITLMMENAGLHLARLATLYAHKKSKILIGVGTGNNGGGGLVASRRLAGWGYDVSLHIPNKNLNDLSSEQLSRAFKFGAIEKIPEHIDMYIDAYLGFSQRIPLSDDYMNAVKFANELKNTKKISLDIPTGLTDDSANPFFEADIICTLAAPKKVLFYEHVEAALYLADIGIPLKVYDSHGIKTMYPFDNSGLLKIIKV